MKADQVAAFIDRRLNRTERLTVEAHLADCPDCRAEVVGASRLIADKSRGRLRSSVTGALAIAAVTLLVVSVSRHASPARGSQLMRGSDPNAITAIGPHGTVPRNGLTLVWAAAGARATYHITLSDALSKTIWVTDGRDTAVVVPGSVDLAPGTDYFWTVDAILAEGSSRTTSAQSFRVTP